jgi:hypothetical protein
METEDFDLKLAYNKLGKKYSLPEFEKLSEDFDIEKISEKEPNFLAREIRRIINEKISGYIHVFEILINPTSPPLFIFSILKNISTKDKEKIRDIYKTLSKTQIEIMKLDTIYKEKSEIKFINETFNMWQETKLTIYKLIENFETGFEKDDISEKRSYLD